MTPDDVVARAKELEGKEVDITVRGVVQRYTGENWGVRRPGCGLFTVSLTDHGRAVDDLVDIQPAPLRIEPGELYADGQGIVYVGITEHEARAVTGTCPGAVTTCAWALRRVKVVDA